MTEQVVPNSDICNPQVCDLPRCCLLMSLSSLSSLISNFRRVLNVVFFLLSDSPSSDFVVVTI